MNMFHYMAISELMQREMPMPKDRIMGVALDYPEVVRLINQTNSLLKGDVGSLLVKRNFLYLQKS